MSPFPDHCYTLFWPSQRPSLSDRRLRSGGRKPPYYDSPQAVGGFAGPGYIEIDGHDADDNNPFIIGEDEAGTLEVSGIFRRFDEGELPVSAALFVYIDNDDAPDDYAFG